jgi:ketosteroid isomerase-like protein
MSDQTKVDTAARQNADVLQRMYEAFGRGDIPAVLDMLTDDAEWTLRGPSALPHAGTHRGREGIAQFFSSLGENLEVERFELREFVAQGDTVVVLGDERCTVKTTGRTFEQEWAHVYTLTDGKIATGRFFEDTAAQVVAFDAT